MISKSYVWWENPKVIWSHSFKIPFAGQVKQVFRNILDFPYDVFAKSDFFEAQPEK